jgi:hypothetical protein
MWDPQITRYAMGKKSRAKQRRRYELLDVQIAEKDINPQSGEVPVSIIIDMVRNEIKAINEFTGLPLDTSKYVQGYLSEHGKFRPTTHIQTAPLDHSLELATKVERYKHIVAIDTNTLPFQHAIFTDAVNVGLGVAIWLQVDAQNWKMQPLTIPFVTSFNSPKPENENWVRLIELLRTACKCTDPRKIAIVVDSDLGMLPEYNARRAPIWGDYLLPDEYELIFASDKVTDNVFNKLIRECHSLSKECLPLYCNHLSKALDAGMANLSPNDSSGGQLP